MRKLIIALVLIAISGCGNNSTTTPAPITLPPLIQPKGMVSISFDDGWYSAYVNGIPIFNNAGFPVTAYVITHSLNGTNGHMTKAQVIELAGLGNEIGGHTQTHPCLSSIQTKLPNGNWTNALDCTLPGYTTPVQTIDNISAQEQEIKGSYDDLIQLLGVPPTSFAYPYGDFNTQTEQILKAVGYTTGRTVNSWDDITNIKSTNKYELFSRCVENHGQSDEALASLINADIDYAIATNSWYILCVHRVGDTDPTNSVENLSIKTLELVRDHLIETRVTVRTVSQAKELMNK